MKLCIHYTQHTHTQDATQCTAHGTCRVFTETYTRLIASPVDVVVVILLHTIIITFVFSSLPISCLYPINARPPIYHCVRIVDPGNCSVAATGADAL